MKRINFHYSYIEIIEWNVTERKQTERVTFWDSPFQWQNSIAAYVCLVSEYMS